MSDSPEVILFDVGGVLCELGDDPVPIDWIPGERRFSLDDWFHSPLALAFEKGQISAEELAAAFREDLEIEHGVKEILAHFDDWLIGPFAGAHELLDAIPGHFRLAILSNTNALHWPKISRKFGFEQRMERIFSSHLLGMAKPDPAIFQSVLRAMNVDPARVLFLDDNAQNVAASRALGMRAVQVLGLDEVRRALGEFGVIRTSA